VAPRLDQQARITVGATSYFVATRGDEPPLLLLHGFPETHLCWQRVAPALAAAHSIVAPDLKGYGASEAPAGGPNGEGYSKREMAAELVELMGALGHDRFAVVGHDRGARVAYRLALDHPERVTRVALLNVVPTVDQFERMGAGLSLGYWPWFLLAQPAPFPERLLGASAEYVVRDILAGWTAAPDVIVPAATERYVSALAPEVIAGMCADYRASFHIDRPMDGEDRRAGRRIDCPVLVHWGAAEGAMSDGPLRVWRGWADAVQGGPLPSGHFIPEEAPDELLASLRSFLSR
jgi:haloacetate dehalogenase